MWQNYTESGRPIELRILFDLGVSVERLALADAAMVASLFLCVPFEKAQIAGWIPRGAGFYIQHAIQTAFFFFWTWIIWVSDWTFFQNGILAMHMLTMLMKVHSYLVTNRELWFKQKALAGLKKKLEELDSGRQEHKGHGGKLPKDESDELADVKDRIEQLEEALFPADGVSYPQNVTFANFLDFLRIPFLVYSLSYPRTAKIRWGYFFEKAAGFFGTIILTYLVISSFILPNLQEANNISVFELIGRLLFPMLIVYVLIFLMVWEYVTNCFAELSRFADRGFYGDW
jgi:sterol O-acyltransferase